MHLRNKHFYSGGTEIDAPSYVYYDKLSFMTDFSIKKYPITPTSSDQLSTMTLTVHEPAPVDVVAPELLTYEQKDAKSNVIVVHDHTEEFIEAVKEFPCLYDEHAELRKYRSNVAWKSLETKFDGRFTCGKLRSVWMQLMKKYKYYMNSYQQLTGSIENEHIFEKLYYVPVEEKMYDKSNVLEIENEPDETTFDATTVAEVEQDFDIETEDEPTAKKVKVEEVKLPEVQQVSAPIIVPPAIPNIVQVPPIPHTAEDEYDLFGKKVALQLREIATKNRSVARRGEIKVLQLLMELEDSIDNWTRMTFFFVYK